MMWSGWKRGKESPGTFGGEAKLFVSVTHFQVSKIIHMPRIVFDGWRLKRRWPELAGAVGTWLWMDWRQLSSGSVSVWLAPEDMQAFVSWPPHKVVAARHRKFGRMTSTSWVADKLNRREIRIAAMQWLSSGRPGLNREDAGARN